MLSNVPEGWRGSAWFRQPSLFVHSPGKNAASILRNRTPSNENSYFVGWVGGQDVAEGKWPLDRAIRDQAFCIVASAAGTPLLN